MSRFLAMESCAAPLAATRICIQASIESMLGTLRLQAADCKPGQSVPPRAARERAL